MKLSTNDYFPSESGICSLRVVILYDLQPNGVGEVYLYDPALLASLDFSTCVSTYKNGVSPQNPGDGLVIRPLSLGDFHNGRWRCWGKLVKIGFILLW